MSVKTMKQSQTAYLARPGFPALIEVQEREELTERLLFVEAISLKMDSSMAGLLKFVGMASIVKTSTEATTLLLAGRGVLVRELF